MTSDDRARELHEIEEVLASLDVCCSDDDVEDWLRLRERRQHLLSLTTERNAPQSATVVSLALWRDSRAEFSHAAIAAVR